MEAKLVVVSVTAAVVGIVIVFHYEVINLLNLGGLGRHTGPGGNARNRPAILATMFVLLFAHVAEIWLFGTAFWFLLSRGGYGAISGYPVVDFLDCIYFSAANYSTVGWGDLAATGDIRFLAGTEALVGFMMITWSASFGYLVMVRTWGRDDD